MEKRPRTEVPASVVRDWARRKGLPVGTRGHLPPSVIRQYNRTHRTIFVSKNPFGPKPVDSTVDE